MSRSRPLSRSPAAARVVRALTHARRPVLFLDLDGTLAPLVSRPEAAAVPSLTRRALERLRESGARVVIVSGRAAVEASRIVGTRVDAIIGNHGADWWRKGRTGAWLGGDQRAIRRASLLLGDLAVLWPGTWLQDKGYSLAIHHRRVRGRQAMLIGEVRHRLRGTGLGSTAGRGVIEVRIRGVDKGAAILRWLDRMEPRPVHSAAVLYAGDDTTDQDAFRALAGDSVSIAVGRRVTGARFRTATPRTLAQWLERLATLRLAAAQSRSFGPRS